MEMVFEIGDRGAGADGFQQEQRTHFLTGGAQLLSHFDGNDAAKTPASQAIRALRLKLAKQLNVMRGHFFDGLMRLRALFQAERLESITWLIGAKMMNQI